MNRLIEIVDSGSFRFGMYLVVACVALWWGEHERRRMRVERHEWWPTYWYTSALLLATMALGRAGTIGDRIGEAGRSQAVEGGWYEAREAIQHGAVLAVTVVWAIGVIVAIWRVPPRRRRYLPHALAISALFAFAAIRIVSLHQVDTLLYRRDIGGIRFVALIELSLLAATVLAATIWSRFPSRSSAVARDADRGHAARERTRRVRS